MCLAVWMRSGNTEGVETVTDLYRTLQMRPEHDKERAAEAGDMDYVVSSTMRQMSQVPKDMSGEGAQDAHVQGGKVPSTSVEQCAEGV